MVMLVVPLGNSDPKSESHRLHEPTLGGHKKKLVQRAPEILYIMLLGHVSGRLDMVVASRKMSLIFQASKPL